MKASLEKHWQAAESAVTSSNRQGAGGLSPRCGRTESYEDLVCWTSLWHFCAPCSAGGKYHVGN